MKGIKVMQNKEYSMTIGKQELTFSADEWKSIYLSLQKSIDEIDGNFYDGIIRNLKNESKKLNERLTKLRDKNDINN